MAEEIEKTEEQAPDTLEEATTYELSLPAVSEDISAAYTALSAVEMFDPGLMEDREEMEEKVYQIRRMSINIIYNSVKFIDSGWEVEPDAE